MSIPQNLKIFLEKNGGTITTAQANQIGISNERLRLLIKRKELERVSHGIYVTFDAYLDEMYIGQLKRSKMIYSHDTALYLHDLTDQEPYKYFVSIPKGYNTIILRKEGYEVFSAKTDYYKLGIMTLPTVFGNPVNVYNMERTICDCLKSHNRLDKDVLINALKRYFKKKDKNINNLLNLAQILKVSKNLRNYLEILL